MQHKKKKTILITGATSGFGLFLAHAFANAGFNLVITGRKKEKLLSLQKELLSTMKINCFIVEADLREEDDIQTIITELQNKDIDILINNAAINPELVSSASLSTSEEINDIFLTNTTSAIILSKGAFEYFSKKGGGIIININSVAGTKGSGHEPLYAASKFGLRGFSESVKEKWLQQGIKVIDVFSGAIATGMSSHRSDYQKLIDPKELALFVVGLCKTKSFFVRDISVQKTGI